MNWPLGIVMGCPLALLTLLIAFGMTGAGHGWITPFFYSFAAVPMAPVSLAALGIKRSRSLTLPIIVLVIGIVLDVMIYRSTIDEGVEYFNKVGDFAGIWIALWSVWQVAALTAICRRLLTDKE